MGSDGFWQEPEAWPSNPRLWWQDCGIMISTLTTPPQNEDASWSSGTLLLGYTLMEMRKE